MRAVVAGETFDTNLSKQLRKGFKAVALIPDYLPEPGSPGWGVVIVWDNPTYDPARPPTSAPIKPRRYHLMPRQRKPNQPSAAL